MQSCFKPHYKIPSIFETKLFLINIKSIFDTNLLIFFYIVIKIKKKFNDYSHLFFFHYAQFTFIF